MIAFTLNFLEWIIFTVISSNFAWQETYVFSQSPDKFTTSPIFIVPVILTGSTDFSPLSLPAYSTAKSIPPVTSARSPTALTVSIWTLPRSFTMVSMSALLSGTLKSSSSVICMVLLHTILFSWISSLSILKSNLPSQLFSIFLFYVCPFLFMHVLITVKQLLYNPAAASGWWLFFHYIQNTTDSSRFWIFNTIYGVVGSSVISSPASGPNKSTSA